MALVGSLFEDCKKKKKSVAAEIKIKTANGN